MNSPWLQEQTANNYMKEFFFQGGDEPLAEDEAELSLDVYETPSEIVVKAPIAGVKPTDLDISLSNDMLTIRGKRCDATDRGRMYLTRECHWGAFSRTVILPVTVTFDRSRAIFEHGILTVRLPKRARDNSIPVETPGYVDSTKTNIIRGSDRQI